MNRTTDSDFPMTHWPDLAPFARTMAVPEIRGELFLYDSERGARGGGDDSGSSARTPVILIHGLGDEADTWRHLFPILARERRVIAPDLPGFGRSAAREKITIKTHAAAVRAIIAETGPAILIGSSMGAAIAELAAFLEPERVKGLVLIDGGLPSAGGLSTAMLANLVPGSGERRYRAWRYDHEGAYQSLAPYYADLDALSDADRDFLRLRVIARVESDSQCAAYFSSFRSFMATAMFRGSYISESLETLRCPIIVLWGSEDRILPPDSREPIFRVRPDARDEMIDGAGHLPHQEKPREVAAILGAFFGTQGL
jgi:pimeloyl-ACP methyl ester carboxylesterase